MPKHTRVKRRDTNHYEITRAFEACGFTVIDTSQVAGFVDIVVGRRGLNFLIEIKDGSKPPSSRKLTPMEEDFHRDWRGQAHIINSVREVIRFSELSYQIVPLGNVGNH